MPSVTLVVNGAARAVDVWDPDMPLLYALRNELGLHGTKFGCGLGQCGACTVLLDDAAVRSCTVRTRDAAGRRVVTSEGLGLPERPHPVQAAFIAEQAAQCGYCTNGMVMASAALLARNPRPTREQAQAALAGNLCRCGSHDRVLKAIARASGQGEA
jgi:nicotinate dehydrogenase subunit A